MIVPGHSCLPSKSQHLWLSACHCLGFELNVTTSPYLTNISTHLPSFSKYTYDRCYITHTSSLMRAVIFPKVNEKYSWERYV